MRTPDEPTESEEDDVACRRAADFLAPDFFAPDFFAADFFAPDFLAPDFFAPDFCAADFCAADFFAAGFCCDAGWSTAAAGAAGALASDELVGTGTAPASLCRAPPPPDTVIRIDAAIDSTRPSMSSNRSANAAICLDFGLDERRDPVGRLAPAR